MNLGVGGTNIQSTARLFLVLGHVGLCNMAAYLMRPTRRISLQRGLSPLLRASPA